MSSEIEVLVQKLNESEKRKNHLKWQFEELKSLCKDSSNRTEKLSNKSSQKSPANASKSLKSHSPSFSTKCSKSSVNFNLKKDKTTDTLYAKKSSVSIQTSVKTIGSTNVNKDVEKRLCHYDNLMNSIKHYEKNNVSGGKFLKKLEKMVRILSIFGSIVNINVYKMSFGDFPIRRFPIKYLLSILFIAGFSLLKTLSQSVSVLFLYGARL